MDKKYLISKLKLMIALLTTIMVTSWIIDILVIIVFYVNRMF